MTEWLVVFTIFAGCVLALLLFIRKTRRLEKADKTDRMPGRVGVQHLLSGNPGEYEIKVLSKGHLARSIKFTVGPGGKFDNGIAAANQLGRDGVIVPVQILGTLDLQWNPITWKTDAFYNNPLQGFTPVP
jgi:hypothetical protein